MSKHHRFEHRPCTLESSIRPGYMISFQVYLLHCCFILSLYFYNNVLHLTSIWLEYHSLFQDLCFCKQVWGYDMPRIFSFIYSYPLIVMFSSIYTLGTMCDSSLGYGRTKHCPIFCYVILEHAVDFEF
jgi:hypothetical protein